MRVDLQSEVSALSGGLNIPLPDDWLAPIKPYYPAISNYLEYQISLTKRELSLITLGSGSDFLNQLESHLAQLQVTSAAHTIFKMLRNQVPTATWGVKQSLGPSPELQLYVKKPLPLDQVLMRLQAQGMDRVAAEQIRAAAGHLEKSHTHFFGADFSPGKPVPFQIYFTQYTTDDDLVAKRLQRVATELQLPAEISTQLADTYTLLAAPKRTIWISLGIVNGSLAPSIKLDYSGISFNAIVKLLEMVNAPEHTHDDLRTVAETLRVATADYLGLRFTANRAPSIGLYTTRIR